MQSTEYAPGRAVDVYGEPTDPIVLLWHGMQTDSRAAVQPLAERLARRGLGVVAPDWNSHADDSGRGDLVQSAAFAREYADGSGLVVVGWSLGGAAAAGLSLDPSQHVARTVCLGGAFTAADPISGRALDRDLPAHHGGAFLLLHGAADDVVPPSASHDFAAHLARAGWPVKVVELDTDHGAIAGARYDPAADRYLPAEDSSALAVAEDVAARIASFAAQKA